MSNFRKCKLIYSDRKLSGMLRAGRDHNRGRGDCGGEGYRTSLLGCHNNHKLEAGGRLNNRSSFRLWGWKCKIKVAAGLVPSEASLLGL